MLTPVAQPKSSVFVIDAAPTGAGSVTGKVWVTSPYATIPANKILTAFESDDDGVKLELIVAAPPGSTDWQPESVTVYGGASSVTLTRDSWVLADSADERVWKFWVTISGTASGTIYVTVTDGGHSGNVTYTRALDPPLILTAVIDNHPTTTGGDPESPLAQTQVSASDTIAISGTTESHANEVYVKDYEVTAGEGVQGPFTVTAGAWSATINCGTGTNATANYQCYAKVTGGAAGADFVSTESIDLDQTVPTFSAVSHSYPAGQEAIKDVETDTVTITHTNAETGDSYLYDDNSTGELTIPATTTYAAGKAVARLSGNYRESGTNYRLTVTRLQKNGLSATKTGTVKIAHTTPVITVARTSGGSALYRLGTDDGTVNYKDQTVYLNSSQANLSTHTPTLAVAAGDTTTWQGSWSTDGDLRYTRSLRVADADINAGGQAANNFTWGACSVKNRAGKEATAVTTNASYSLGGFATRTINMGPITGGDPPYTHTGDIGVPVVDTSKTTVVNASKGGTPTQTYEGNVTEHNDADSSLNDYWTTVAALASESFDDYTQYFHSSDKKFYDGITAPGGFNCTIAESA